MVRVGFKCYSQNRSLPQMCCKSEMLTGLVEATEQCHNRMKDPD